MAGQALDGIVVTEMGSRIAVAVCGSLLSQLGATVVAIEAPGGTKHPSDKATRRRASVAGKLSFAPRSEFADDRELLESFALFSDVTLISSDVNAPIFGCAANDNLANVLCDITAFGATGPLAHRPYSDLQIQALSGIMDTTGMPDGPPVPIGVLITDFLAGTYAASAVLAALRVKREQGIGQAIGGTRLKPPQPRVARNQFLAPRPRTSTPAHPSKSFRIFSRLEEPDSPPC